ncbi:hypothetical protein LTS10_004747 [Elasticomyces elasticus]|nr:hypothetical protein LTS10_004747 [Elasticomyces elasticus]
MDPPRKADADPGPGWQLVERKKNKVARLRAEQTATSKVSTFPALTPDQLGLLRITIPTDPRSLKDRYGEDYAILVDFAQRDIRDANLQSLAKYMHPLELLHLPAPITWPDKYQYATSGVREITVVRRSLELVTRFRIGLRFTASGICQAVIITGNEDNRGVSIKEWLAGLAEPDVELPTGECGYELQAKWWEARGRFCDFPALSEDIQHKLLLHMVGEVCEAVMQPGYGWDKVNPGYLLRQTIDSPQLFALGRYFTDYESHERHHQLPRGLFRLDKSTCQQLQSILRCHVTKRFSSYPEYQGYHRQILELQALPSLAFLNRIQLKLSDREYARFFGAVLHLPLFDSRPAPAAALLAELPGLRHIEICFESVIEMYLASDQRGDTQYLAGWFFSGRGIKQQLAKHAALPCRKAIVDFLLSFAYKHLKDIPRVNLTGDIKQSTRDRWMIIFSTDECDREAMEARLDAHIGYIKNLPTTDWPAPCYCPVPCESSDMIKAWEASHRGPNRFPEVYGEVGTCWDQYINEAVHWKHQQAIQCAIDDYRFDHDDLQLPVEYSGIGRKRERREVRVGDAYAW